MFFRKQRRANSNPPAPGASSSSSISPLNLPKTHSRTSIKLTDTAENVRSTFGLNLLNSPLEEPQIDLIFIQGLGGNSWETWSITTGQLRSPSHCWPHEWLPKDPAFKNVRIHSYGYSSDYSKGKDDCLNIHHIGKSFLGAISTSPCLADSDTPIVAIGHSMGGLVMKKAYNLARQDGVHKTLAGRFSAFYFLATPHRGADSAKMLKKMLKVAYDRAYVADLERNSGAIQVINDEFRHFSTGLELWSFYETQNMKQFSSLIVDPESAVLGYPGENQIPMTADHRSICKFETPLDANYVLLKDALASTVSKVTATVPEVKSKEKRIRTKNLKKYLDVSDVLDDDLLSYRGARMKDSCQWISTKPTYFKWKDNESGRDKTMWIKGKPATGKSVLAGFIIDNLQEHGHSCSYFFFKHGDKSKSGIGRCLRSLAFQMASLNTQIADAILEMQEDGIRLDHVDERTLWRILFMSAVFRARMTRHYWVIDALDECSNPSVLFDAIIPSIDESSPLRILITSRETVDLERGFSGIPSNSVQSLSISITDTQQDLRLLVGRKVQTLLAVESNDRAPLAEKILGKSNGSFLWTILVLEELSRCHSKNEIDQTLEDVPRGMESLYRRILDSMSQSARGKNLAKAILMWSTCFVRPMTITELNGALSLDIEDSFPRLEESITALCGQLVAVDKLGRVQMVHQTAREFLLSGTSDSEFFIDESKAHTRIAHVCLTYLVGDEMKPPRTSRRRSLANLPTARLGFAAYAYTAYSYHISWTNPLAVGTFQLVQKFLRSNVLTWIEAIADSQNLNQLIRASKHLKTYVNACAAETSPLDPRIRALRQWTTDLARIPAMFADALTTSPAAIYSLIPPFCPTDSMIYKTSGPGRKLTVLGASNEQWDDRLLCIDFGRGRPSVICHGEEFLAVGLTAGLVTLYYAASYQEYKTMDHGEHVKFISFKGKADLIATCGLKMTKLWNIRSGEMVHSFKSPPRPLAMDFDGDVLLVASHKNYVASWDLSNTRLEPVRRPWSDTQEMSLTSLRQPPWALTLSVNNKLLAVAYSGRPITLWDMEQDAYAGSCGKKLSSGETSTHPVVALAFNPNPNIGLLAVAYLDGDLAVVDPLADQQLECFRANCQTIAPSPNGRLLAAGGANGIIDVYEFDTLKLLYRVKSSNSYIKQISFARDSLHLCDIRGAQCTVWEPETLLRDSLSDDSSGATSTSTPTVEMVSVEAKVKITTIAVEAEVVFCGKDDGSVVLYSRKTAKPLRKLCSHKAPIRMLTWCQKKNSLLSVDASNKVLLHEIHKLAEKDSSTDVKVFETRLESEKAVVDVLVGEAVDSFVLSTRESDHLFSLVSGEHQKERICPAPGVRKWVSYPGFPENLVCFNGVNATCSIQYWEDLSEVRSFTLSLDSDTAQLKTATLCSFGKMPKIVLEYLSLDQNKSADISNISILDAQSHALAHDDNGSLREEQADPSTTIHRITTDKNRESNIATSRSVAPLHGWTVASVLSDITQVIGINEFGKLVFLDRSSWICSVELGCGEKELGQRQRPELEVSRHFFVPYDWLAATRDVVCALAQEDIMLTRGGDLAVIRGGFAYSERV